MVDFSQEGGFNADDHEEFGGDYTPIPDGEYEVILDKFEEVESKSSGVPYWKLTFKVDAGEYSGRLIFERLFPNGTAKANQIAMGKLSSITKACGLGQIMHSDELIGIPFRVKVKIRNEKDADGNPRQENAVSSYKPLNGDQETGSTVSPSAAAAKNKANGVAKTGGSGGAKRPWDK